MTSKTFGKILVSSSGRTLYRYTIDRKGVNRCTANATCNKYWPPLLVKAGAKATAGTGATASKLGTIKAKNGMRQVTYAGWPLYLFAFDKAAGQTKGQGFEKQWYVVNTNGALVKHARHDADDHDRHDHVRRTGLGLEVRGETSPQSRDSRCAYRRAAAIAVPGDGVNFVPPTVGITVHVKVPRRASTTDGSLPDS